MRPAPRNRSQRRSAGSCLRNPSRRSTHGHQRLTLQQVSPPHPVRRSLHGVWLFTFSSAAAVLGGLLKFMGTLATRNEMTSLEAHMGFFWC